MKTEQSKSGGKMRENLLRRFSGYRKVLKSPSILMKTFEAALNPDSIIIRWPSKGESKNNYGDKLNVVLCEKISKKRVYNYSDIMNITNHPRYSVIGSSLGNRNDENVIVWGTGFISFDRKPLVPPKNICAVRGPLSRKKFLDAGMDCPDVYGDPALFCPKYFQFKIEKKYKIGLIPQWRDSELPIVSEIRGMKEIKVININDSIENVIKNILSCEKIISSTLHGLITADAYEVPSTWLRLSENPLGDWFKFQDYYESLGIKNVEPAVIKNKNELDKLADKCVVHDMNVNLNRLMDACPFRG